ncbi:hypothetical protein GCM10010176_024180 [Nonomuraea spiralis]|nr:hypothetical protein GCM10010176_024180 [Nonomuraea spiralis]
MVQPWVTATRWLAAGTSTQGMRRRGAPPHDSGIVKVECQLIQITGKGLTFTDPK